MLWAAVLVWHYLIQSSLLKCPARMEGDCCYLLEISSTSTLPTLPRRRQWHGFWLGVNYFLFSSLHRQEMIGSLRLLTESRHSLITSCFLLLSAARSNDSSAGGYSTAPPPRCAHHQTCTALLQRKAVAPMGTGTLIIIPRIPGEAFIWRFQRIYPFPASRIMRKPYNTADMQAGQLHCVTACWVPKRVNVITKSTKGTFIWSSWVLSTTGSQDASFEPCSSRQLGLKIWAASYPGHSTEFWHCRAKMPLLKKAVRPHIMQHRRKWCTNLLQRVYWAPIHHLWSATTLI